MIVADPSQLAIQAGVRSSQDALRRAAEERVKRYLAYDGRGIADAVSRYFTQRQLQQAPCLQQKVCRKIIDARFSVYKQAPVRIADERYLDRMGDLDEDMTFLERMTGLQGSMAMLRYYDAEREILDSLIIPVFEPLFLPGETEPFGVIYPLHQPEERDTRKQRYAVWTDVEHYEVTASGGVSYSMTMQDGTETTEHGLGVLPVLFAHAGPPVGQEWMRAGADDVVNAQTVYNVQGTHLSHCVLWQTHGQATATGVRDPKDAPKIGVDTVVCVPEGGSFRFETPGGNTTAIIESMKFIVESVAYANHLQVKWAGGGGATSGEHLRIMEVDLTEANMADFRRWEAFERQRFVVDRALLDAQGLSVGEEYSVTFGQPHIPESPEQLRAEWEWRMKHGLMTRRMVLREMNPGITEEALDALVEELAAETGPEMGVTGGPAETPASAFARALAAPV